MAIIKIIFINNIYILTKNINKIIKKFAFFYLLVKWNRQKIIKDIFSVIYNCNIQNRKKKLINIL